MPAQVRTRNLPSAEPGSRTESPKSLLSLRDAADYWGVSERSLRQYIADGLVPAYRLPGRDGRSRLIRVRLDDLEAAMRPAGGAS